MRSWSAGCARLTTQPGMTGKAGEMTVDEYFVGQEEARRIFDALCGEIETLGAVDEQVRAWLERAWLGAE